MTDTLIKTLEAKAGTSGADLSSIGAVQATVAGEAAKIPMSTTRAADGSDAVGAAPSGVEPEVGGSGQLGWLGTIAFVLRAVKTALLELSNKLPSSLGQKSPLQSMSVVLAAGTELPVTGPLTEQQLRSQAVTVGGEVTANLGSLNGAATDATLAELKALMQAQLAATQALTASNQTLIAHVATQNILLCDALDSDVDLPDLLNDTATLTY
jgi:hypothetical protein